LSAVLAVPVLAGMVVVFVFVGRWLSVADPVHPVDAIVVTSGAPDVRVPKALELAERGTSTNVWVAVWDKGPVVDEEARIRSYVAQHTRGRVTLTFVGPSRSMLDEARIVSYHLARSRPRPRSIAVIVPPWESARARLAFQRTVGDTDVSVWSDGTRYDAARWWRSARTTTIIEAAKTGATLALLGPHPDTKGERPPPTIPLRALVGAFVVAALAGAACRRIAHRLGLVAVPRLWRGHATPTPMLGGLAILLGIAAGGIAAGGIRLGSIGAVATAGVAVLGLVGFVDDIAGLGAGARLALWA